MTTLGGMINEVPALKEYLENPIVARQDKEEDMLAICSDLSDISKAFIRVLAENGRLGETEKVLGTFSTLMNAKRGLVEVTVTSAEKLSKSQLTSLQDSLATRFLEKGQSLKLSTSVNAEMLGGLQVQIGDKFIDLSVASQLNKLSKHLEAEGI